MKARLILIAAAGVLVGTLVMAAPAEAGHVDWSFGVGFHVGGLDFRIGLGPPVQGYYPGPFFVTASRLHYPGYGCHDRCFRRGRSYYHHAGCPLLGLHFGHGGYGPDYYISHYGPYRSWGRGYYRPYYNRSYGYYYRDGYRDRYYNRGGRYYRDRHHRDRYYRDRHHRDRYYRDRHHRDRDHRRYRHDRGRRDWDHDSDSDSDRGRHYRNDRRRGGHDRGRDYDRRRRGAARTRPPR